MNVVVFCLLTLISLFRNAFSHTCASSGFSGCECNILGACDIQGNHVTGLDNKLTGYAPMGIPQFQYGPVNFAYLCEGQTTTILYDCNAKIPLYSATMMTGNQLNTPGYNRIGNSFKQSGDTKLSSYFQQSDSDYLKSNDRVLCYESQNKKYLIDEEWYLRKIGNTKGVNKDCKANTPQAINKAPMARGHLIAAQYGRGNPTRISATFTYTNTVPQFASFNSGKWGCSEKKIITWGRNNCATSRNVDVRMFIVVGAIPSTYTRRRRYFGQSGFSDFQGWSRLQNTYLPNSGGKEYRVNVPSYLWTAACCTFRYQDAQGNWQDGTESTAFFRSNDQGNGACIPATPKTLFKELKVFLNKRTMETDMINIFPKNSNC